MWNKVKALIAGLLLIASLLGAISLGSAQVATAVAQPLAAQSHLAAYTRLGPCGGAASTPC